MRLVLLTLCLSAFLFASLPSSAAPVADADAVLPDPRDMARIEASVDRALEYLVKSQNPDGSWVTGGRNGVNAFCLLAFLGRGHEPGRGPYKMVVDRGISFLIAQQADTGLIGPQMYDHALSTLALIEAYGFIPRPEMRKTVQKAVDLIVRAQSPSGGWRYNPAPGDQDLSASVMQIVALRAAQNARLDVPQKTIDGALKFVRSVAAPTGGFGYQSPAASPAQSAAGTLSMALLGAYDEKGVPDPTITKGLEYMKANRASYAPGQAWFFYASYYAMQANFQAGGSYWANWHPTTRDQLLTSQNEDGTWPGFAEEAYNAGGKCYSTALGAMCLSVYMHYLPAYQR
jgi:hypothetical protein